MEFLDNLNLSWLIAIICAVALIMTFMIILIGIIRSAIIKKRTKAA